jgi:uncharacterized membrane protein YtjA (UPF0391 family)
MAAWCGTFMKYYSLFLLLLAAACGALGFGELAGPAASVTRGLFVVFFLLFAVALDRAEA